MDMPAHAPQGEQERLRRGRASVADATYLVTATTHERERLFEGWRFAAPAAATFERPGVLRESRMLAWVLMPDHAHWLLTVGEGDTLQGVVGRLKSASAREANRGGGREGRVWQPAFHDRAMRKDDDLAAAARYIVANPKRAGLVRRVGDYPYWNAVWL
jgi:REP element-mobilizing transposase RayT